MSSKAGKSTDKSSKKIKHNEIASEYSFNIYDFDSGDRFDRMDREINAMENFLQPCQGSPTDRMEVNGHKLKQKGKFGLDPDNEQQIPYISESTQNVGEPMDSCPPNPHRATQYLPNPEPPDLRFELDDGIDRASDLLVSVLMFAEINRRKIIELAVAAMDEMTKMALMGHPLWQLGVDGETEILNDIEYIHYFGSFYAIVNKILSLVEVRVPDWPQNNSATPNDYGSMVALQTEASRETGYIPMDPNKLVQMLMDENLWSYFFPNIVTKAVVLGILSEGATGNSDGALKVMTAEFHMPTPLVPTRETYFARYCKQLDTNTWGIVDVSLENIFPNPIVRYRRRPSGCLIQGMNGGYTKVTWVDHVEIDNRMVHKIFHPLVVSGYVFGAKRWVATLVRQCERLAVMTASSSHHRRGGITKAGRDSLFKLADRMIKNFCADVCGSTENMWLPLPLSGFEDVRAMVKSNIYSYGRPPAISVVVATTFFTPEPVDWVFNFLRNGNSRTKWDRLARGHIIQEIVHIPNGNDARNCISMQRVTAPPNHICVHFLLESFRDLTGSYVVYAPMDTSAVSMVLSGGNSDNVLILPSGFAIMPCVPISEGKENRGSFVTVMLQMLDPNSTITEIPSASVGTICRTIADIVSSIRNALRSYQP